MSIPTKIGGVSGASSSYAETKTDSAGGIDEFRVSVNIQPGEAQFDYFIDGNLEISPNETWQSIRGNDSPTTVNLKVRPARFTQLKNRAQDLIFSEISEITGVPERAIEEYATLQTNVPTPFRDYVTQMDKGYSLQVSTGSSIPLIGGIDTVGSTPIEDSESFTFQPPVVPVPEGERIDGLIDEEYWPSIVFELSPAGVVRGVLSGTASVEFTIPPHAFIQTETVDFSDCFALFSNLGDRIEEFTSNTDGIEQRATTLRNNLRSISERLQNEGIEDPRNLTEDSFLEGISEGGEFSITGDMLDEWRQTLEEADNFIDEYNQLSDTGFDLQQDISEVVGSNCISELAGPVQERRSKLNNLESAINTIDSYLEELGIIFEVTELSEASLGCDAIPQMVHNAVAEYEEAVSTLQNANPTRLRPERVNGVIDEASEVMGLIRENSSQENSCRSRLLNRVRQTRSEATNIQTFDPDSIPCSEKFPEVDNTLSELESRSNAATADIAEQELGQINSLEQDVASSIQDLDDAECIQQFKRRLQRSGRQVDRVANPIRISEEAIGQAQQRRRELINDIDARLEGLDVPSADIDS